MELHTHAAVGNNPSEAAVVALNRALEFDVSYGFHIVSLRLSTFFSASSLLDLLIAPHRGSWPMLLMDEYLTHDIVVRARAFVANPETWSRCYHATDRDGHAVAVTSPLAVRFSAYDAFKRAAFETVGRAHYEALGHKAAVRVFMFKDIYDVNNRGQKAVLKTFDAWLTREARIAELASAPGFFDAVRRAELPSAPEETARKFNRWRRQRAVVQ